MTVRYLSVCSGIEAATMAWHPLGWSPVAFAEIEPFPCAVLAHHYGSNLPGEPLATNGVPNLGDITRFAAWPDLAIDLLVGGTPCQSFSVAGLRKGLADPRGNLALTYLAIANRYRPCWVVWENVPGVLSSDGGRDFGAFLGGLGELGYGFAYRVLDAQFVRVDGFGRAVPQRRRRVFVVGYLGDWRRAAAVLFDAAGLHGDPAPSRGPGKVAPTIPSRSLGGGGLGTDFDCDGGLVVETLRQHPRAGSNSLGALAFGGNRQSGPLDVATAVDAHGGPHGRQDFESETFVVSPPLTSNPYGDHESREGLLVPIAFDPTQITSRENRSRPEAGDPCHPLAAAAHPPLIAFDCKAGGDTGFAIGDVPGPLRGEGHGGGHSAIAFQSSQSGVRESDTHATLDANMGSRRHNGAVTPSGVRRLLPVECERLQAFPDGYTAVPFRAKPATDGPRYKALGNSMAVNAMRWVGRRIEAVNAIGAEMREAAE